MKSRESRKNKKPRETAISKMLRKAFGDLEVADATKGLLIIPIPCDFENAIKKNPRHCGLSRCVARMFGATLALFFKGSCYVDLVGEDGVRRVYRYKIGQNVLSMLAAFDRDQSFLLGRSITLSPPPPGSKLEHMRKRNHEWRRSDVGKALTAEANARRDLRAVTQDAKQCQDRIAHVRQVAKPDSPKAKEAEQQFAAARKRLRAARERFDSAHRCANEARTKKFQRATPPAPRHYDLSVRNASAFFSRIGAQQVGA